MNDIQFDYSKNHAYIFVIFLLIYEISAYMANDMIMPGMLSVVHSFKAPDGFVSTSLTAFILGGASLQLFLGPVSDRFGRRPVMLTGVAFFLCATLFLSASYSINMFILGRFLQGMGLCFISVIGYATLHELFTELSAVRLISIMNIITILAPLAGPLLGAAILHFFSWQIIFIVIAILAAAALIGLGFYMPETVNTIKKDGSYVPSAAFNWTNITKNYLSLLQNKCFMFGALALSLANIPIIAWIGVSPLILMKTAHLSVFTYALWQFPVFFTATVGNLVMRKLTQHTPLSKLSHLGAGLLVSALLLTGLLPFIFNTHYIWIILGISLYGFALGLTTGPLTRITLFSTFVPKGTASALMSLMTMAFTALGNELAGHLYTDQKNLYFSLFCGICGIIHFLFYQLFRYHYKATQITINQYSNQ